MSVATACHTVSVVENLSVSPREELLTVSSSEAALLQAELFPSGEKFN
jgi:hypothetical protein